jgi:tRNA (Thr-GGU) A37 N-methylase
MTPNNGHQPTYQLHPIGYVRTQEGSFTLEILPPYRPALKELRQFSHALIFWWANLHDNAADRARTTAELPYAPEVTGGVFACRAPYRPNPIALTTMFILDVDEANGIVTQPWINAEDGIPEHRPRLHPPMPKTSTITASPTH